jgi:hypothetical protein
MAVEDGKIVDRRQAQISDAAKSVGGAIECEIS